MEAEAKPVIEKLGLTALADSHTLRGNFPRFQGEFEGKEIIISLNGKSSEYGVDRIGTEFAALNTQSAILEFAPDLIINAGTCGAFSADADIADIITSDQPVVYHDHRVPMEGFSEFATGHHPVTYKPDYFQGVAHKLGVVTTGNSLDMPEVDRQIIEQNRGMAKEMECASVAAVASLYGIDFFPIKSVTDHVDIELDNVEQFLENLNRASLKLSETLIKVLTNID
ncbi:hypothetical protein GV64_09340 [Endozoicomonas elysicola]|uniref:Nucleoside phosphorylase domain-containing protein n=2 Tax=Endozoicomonas elysicola TaxID=305900 RepID=A0A081K9U2_9GAMM|nr:hypothetical protein GV64_09340 [Endozoicomonas elysicola]